MAFFSFLTKFQLLVSYYIPVVDWLGAAIVLFVGTVTGFYPGERLVQKCNDLFGGWGKTYCILARPKKWYPQSSGTRKTSLKAKKAQQLYVPVRRPWERRLSFSLMMRIIM